MTEFFKKIGRRGRCGAAPFKLSIKSDVSDLSQAANFLFFSKAYTELDPLPHSLIRCVCAGLGLSNGTLCLLLSEYSFE